LIEIILLLALIAALAAISALMQKREIKQAVAGRKLLHIGAIGASALSVYLVPEKDWLLYTVLILLPLVILAVWKGFLKNPVDGRRSWGMVWYAVVFAALLTFFRDSEPHLVYYTLMVLALADGFAAIAGVYFRLKPYTAGGDERTIAGSVVFYLTACAVLFYGEFFIGVSAGLTNEQILFVALFITMVEAASSNGSDNLWVPVALVYWLLVFPEVGISTEVIVSAIVLPFAAMLAFRLKWLSSGGAIVALLFGWFYIFSPAPEWVVVPLVFFVCGSLLSKLNSSRQKGPARSSMQVLANGGVPAALLAAYFLTGSESFLVGFICGFGAALSDTSSSEIGVKLGQPTFSIIGFKSYPPGLSGGISIGGTLAGLIFAGINAIISAAVFGHFSLTLILIFITVAFAGNVMDSLTGQFLQVKYLNKITREWQDTPPDGVLDTHKGVKGITNDVVNLISTTFAGAAGYFIYSLYTAV
jgi:uncharacterized protein (TIGR00297 family)